MNSLVPHCLFLKHSSVSRRNVPTATPFNQWYLPSSSNSSFVLRRPEQTNFLIRRACTWRLLIIFSIQLPTQLLFQPKLVLFRSQSVCCGSISFAHAKPQPIWSESLVGCSLRRHKTPFLSQSQSTLGSFRSPSTDHRPKMQSPSISSRCLLALEPAYTYREYLSPSQQLTECLEEAHFDKRFILAALYFRLSELHI